MILGTQITKSEEQTRHLVMEYRARTALVDFGPWRDSIINQGINYSWGDNLNRECGSGVNPPDYLSSSYAPTTTEGTQVLTIQAADGIVTSGTAVLTITPIL